MEKRLETILALELPYQKTLKLQRSVYWAGAQPRVAIVAGLHGDAVEGLYVCHRLAAWLEELNRTHPEALLGQVEFYPGMNPLGLDTLQRAVPVYDSDLNRSFPGHPQGLLPQRIAATAMAQLQGAALVIALHNSSVYLQELPQARIAQRFVDTLLPLARRLNLDVIWIQEAGKALEASLAFNLNQRGTLCLAVEMGAAQGLTPRLAEQLLTGVCTLWRDLGVLAADLELPKPSGATLVASDAKIHPVSAPAAGLFVPTVELGGRVSAGQSIGRIITPFQGGFLGEVCTPATGKLLSLRHYPLIYEGSLLARIVEMPNLE